jgi:aminoglycoside phosphotransferase (APT) family kinase protein
VPDREREQALEALAASDAADVLGRDVRISRALTGGGGRAVWELEATRGSFIARIVDARDLDGLKREQRLGEFLSFLPVEVPRLTLHEAPPGLAIALHRKIQGEPFDPEAFAHCFSARDREAFVSDVADLLNRLHAIPLEDACRCLELNPLTRREAARLFGCARWFDAAQIEERLAAVLSADPKLDSLWQDTRSWLDAYSVDPDDMLFGHGDLHGGNMALLETSDGFRLNGVFDLQIGGIVHLYDEFLRIRLLDVSVGQKIVEAYNRLPGQTRTVNAVPLGHFYRAFVFYLLHQSTNESYSVRLLSMLRTDR